MGKEPYSHYDYLLKTDEAINEMQTMSNFNYFAKQFQPNNRKETRYRQYENYFAKKSFTATPRHAEAIDTA